MATVTGALTPDDIDLEFIAHLAPELEVATIGEERIVIGGSTKLVVLNPTAALVFEFLDGAASLGELVDDFSDALGVDRAVVEEDVLTFVRDLGANGLLEGVELPAPELPEWPVVEGPKPLEVGDELADFTLPDLDGDDRSLSDFRGTRVLLVNWSPGCGFCVRIAAELGALHPLLLEHGVELVFTGLGDADGNRAVFDEAGLTAPMLLGNHSDADPFRGTGTPAAYLLDEDGCLLEPMVVGADQVPVLARDLAGVDPAMPYGAVAVPETAEAETADDGPRGRYLPGPGGMCGPGGGVGGSNGTDWLGRVPALDDYHVGVRYNTSATAEVLDRLFAGARIDDRRVPDNYSIALTGAPTSPRDGAPRALDLLVRGGTQLVRSRSGGRVLAALLQYLSADFAAADPSLTRVQATAAVRDGEAILLPSGLADLGKQVQPRLAQCGVALVDVPRVLLDVAARELVVPEPSVPYDASVIDELDAGVRLGRELPWVRPGRYPLRAWLLARGTDHPGPLRPAIAVTAALPMLYDLDDLVAAVERMADLFTDVTPYGIRSQRPDDLVDQVCEALDRV